MNKRSSSSSLGNSLFNKIYLVAYNLLQFLGWSYLFYQFVLEASKSQINNHRLWNEIKFTLSIIQFAQFIEVLHCLIGLVKSNALITFQQIFTKNLIVFGIATPFIGPKFSLGIFLVTGCWSIAEITRYLYYASNILNLVPYALTWCRYSFFLILYPIGAAGELLLIFSSLNEISKNPNLSFQLPNVLNVSFYLHFILIAFMLLYIPLFPPMYIHMLNQRKKIIGDGSLSKDSTKLKAN